MTTLDAPRPERARTLTGAERAANRKKIGIQDGDRRHGTYNGYSNYGCRCLSCIEANRQHTIDYRLRNAMITLERAEALRADVPRRAEVTRWA